MAGYTREELHKLGIFKIREIAKEVGVSSPTKKNKAELVELIFKITSGEMAPPVAPRRGRPKKTEDTPESEGATVAETATDKKPVSEGGYVRRDNRGGGFRPVSRFGQGARPAFSEDKRPDVPEQIREGFLEISGDGYGFLRVKNGECNEMDAYVHASVIKQFGLRRGDYVKASCKILKEGKPAAVMSVLTVNGEDASRLIGRPSFDDLVPIYPDERLRLEIPSRPRDYAIRCIDLVAPIGKGQRGIIVSPPKAGKTTLLKMIAGSIAENYPDIVLFVLLIDERPEEVTDMQRSVRGEVIYSTFDETPEHHTKTAEMLLDRAKRLVEMGKDVVILMDSLTRLARAYNTTIPPTGRTPQTFLRFCAQHRARRLSHHNSDRAHRHRQSYGRSHFRRVQRNGQYGDSPRPQTERTQDIPRNRPRKERHPQRGTSAYAQRTCGHLGSAENVVGR